MKLVSLTPQESILLTLEHGMHTYTELRRETGLSDRWLTAKLRQMQRAGFLDKRGAYYGLKGGPNPSAYEQSLFMAGQAGCGRAGQVPRRPQRGAFWERGQK